MNSQGLSAMGLSATPSTTTACCTRARRARRRPGAPRREERGQPPVVPGHGCLHGRRGVGRPWQTAALGRIPQRGSGRGMQGQCTGVKRRAEAAGCQRRIALSQTWTLTPLISRRGTRYHNIKPAGLEIQHLGTLPIDSQPFMRHCPQQLGILASPAPYWGREQPMRMPKGAQAPLPFTLGTYGTLHLLT